MRTRETTALGSIVRKAEKVNWFNIQEKNASLSKPELSAYYGIKQLNRDWERMFSWSESILPISLIPRAPHHRLNACQKPGPSAPTGFYHHPVTDRADIY